MATDGQLIRQIQQGESDAFNQLFRKYQKHIYSVCLSILKNPQDAEEVVSDTFIHAYLKFDQLKNPENFFAWLRKIAQNRSRDFLRSKREEAIPFVYATEQPCRQSAPDESLLKQELMDAVMEAIELLPHKDREVLRAHIDGLSHMEISEKLGISYEASKSRLYRARKNIAEYAKDLLNTIFGLPKMLPVKKIISGGIMAMKIGTSAKVTIGVIVVLVAGFIGFQVVTRQPDVKSSLNSSENIQKYGTKSNISDSTKRPARQSDLARTSKRKIVGELTHAEREAMLQWLNELESEDNEQLAHQTGSNVESEAVDKEDERAKARQAKIRALKTQIQELKQQMDENGRQQGEISRQRDERRELLRQLEAQRMDELNAQRKKPRDEQDSTQLLIIQRRMDEIIDEINELGKVKQVLFRLYEEPNSARRALREELKALQAQGEDQ